MADPSDPLAIILKHANQGILMMDGDQRLVVWNERYERLLKYPEGFLRRGLSGLEIALFRATRGDFGPGDAEQLARERFLSLWGTVTDHQVIRLFEGRVYEVDIERTSEQGLVITYSDVSERVHAEDQLRESEARFRDFASAATDRFWETDVQHRFTFSYDSNATTISPSTQSVLGRTRWEIAGADLLESEFWRGHKALLDAHESFRDFIIKTKDEQGETKYFSVNGVPLFGENGEFQGYRGTASDVTSREQLNQLKSEFISTVSHELRTPLTSIRGALGLVAGGATGTLSPEAENLIQLAERNSDRLILLVNDILDMEKLQTGKMEYRFQLEDLADTTKRSIEANRGYGEEFGVEFTFLNTVESAPVWIDPDRIEQVLANLLSNAAKFSPRGASVEISISELQFCWRVSVKDMGPGIPEAFQADIFQRFRQANSSDTREKMGTGLGLSIAKSIVEDHDGTISFTTELNVGSTFMFDLPKQIAR